MDALESVHAKIAELQKQAEELAIQQKPGVIEEIKAKIKRYGITARELGFGDKTPGKPNPMAGVTIPIKYRQGDNVWTGRGKQPKFIVDFIASGGNLDDLLV